MALENILSQEIVQKLGWTLLHFVWQAAAAALLLGILLAVLRKSSASVRYIIACAALGLIVLLPIITMQLVPLSTPQPIANIEPPPAHVIAPVQLTTEEMPLARVKEYEEPVKPESTDAEAQISWKHRAVEKLEQVLPYLVAGWLLGVFGLSLWHLGGWAQLQRLKKHMVRRVDASLQVKLNELSGRLRIKQAVQLLESALVQVPTVVGWLRPVILLPASALTGLTTEQLEALLAHELAHIRRYDYLINMLQTVVETLGFYHPAVWWVSHRIRVERENCCDDLAVSISGDRVCYARALTSMEEIRAGRSELAVAATGGNLFSRIRRLVGKDSTESSGTSWIPSVITILLIAIIAIPTTLVLTAHGKTENSAQFLLDRMLEHRCRVRNLQYVAEDVIWRDPAAEKVLIEEQIKSMRESGIPERELERIKQSIMEAPESRYQILKCTIDDEERIKIEQTGGTYDSSGNKVPNNEKMIWAWNGVVATDFSQRSGLPASATIRDTPQVVTKLGHPWRSFTGIFCGFLEETIAAEKPVSVEELKDGTYRVAFDYKASRYVAIVDPSKGYTCALQESYNKQGQLDSRSTAKHKEVVKGIWFPVSGQREDYTPDGSVRHKSTVNSSQIRINDPAFNTGYFDVDMPEGTAVRDNVQGKQYVVGSKRVYDLVEPQKPSTEEEQVDPNSWQEKFYSIYRLEDGQVLKRIAPPYIPERTGYFKSVQPGRYSPNTPPHVVSQYFYWDGKLSIRGASVGGGIRRLKSILESVIGLGNREYDIPPDILSADMSGDWIVRKDTPQEELLLALEQIIKEETGKEIDFVKQKVKTYVIIAKGKYNFQLLPNITDGQYVLISTNKTDTYTGGGGGSGTLDKFLRWVGNRVGMNIIDETEAEGVKLSWRNHDSSDLSRLNHDGEPYNQKMDLLLKNLTWQTGLTFSRETATVEKWFISENGIIKAPQKTGTAVPDVESGARADMFDPSGPVVAKSATPSAEDKSIVKVDLSVVEVSSDSKMDSKTTTEIKNLLGGKITIPDSPAAADLLRKAAKATAEVKDESAGDKRLTQQQFNTLFDLLASRGYVKILTRPTLEVIDGQTAKIQANQDSIQITPNVLENGYINLQVEAALSSQSIRRDDKQTPITNKLDISTQIRLSPWESGIIGGIKQSGLLTESGKETKNLEAPVTEILIILTPTIVQTTSSLPKQPLSLVGSNLPGFQELQIAIRPDDLKNRKILLCFWDMQQRPSRNLIDELAKKEKEMAEKNVIVLLVHTSDIEPSTLKEWLYNHNIPFPCGSIKNDAEKVLFNWGVRAQPWLILTDQNRIVRAEGFSLDQLDEKLLEKIPNVQIESWEKSNKPLHKAVAYGDIEQVRLLLSKATDVREKDDNGLTALHVAAEYGHRNIAELLLTKDVDVNAKGSGDWTALHSAAVHGYTDLAELLIAKGADVNAKDKNGKTPLHFVASGPADLAALLISKGADVNAKDNSHGQTPLHMANADVTEILLNKGADINAKNKWGQTPLYCAAGRGSKDVVELLLAKGANVNAKDDSGNTPLHLAAEQGQNAVVELLIAKGAHVNEKDENANTPLHKAAYQGHKDVIEMLLGKGADLNMKNKWGWTPLHHAVTQGQKDVVEVLIANGADVNAQDNNGQTVLWWAENTKHKEIAELLQKHGAKKKPADDNQKTPITEETDMQVEGEEKNIKTDEVVLKLVDPNSQPVVGARVGTYVDWSDIAENPPIWFLRYGRNRTAANVKSDEHGKVTLEAEEIFGSGWTIEGIAPLTAIDEGHYLAGLRELSRKDLGKEVTLTLQPGCRVHGIVSSATARKWKWTAKILTVYVDWQEHRPCQYTSKQGRFEFVLPPGRYKVEVYSDDPDKAVILPILIMPGQRDLDLTKYLDGTSKPPVVQADTIVDAEDSVDVAKKTRILQLDCVVLEVSPPLKMDKEITNMLGDFPTMFDPPMYMSSTDLLLGKAAGDKRTARERIGVLIEKLVSGGRAKMLMHPNLELAEGQTHKFETASNFLQVTPSIVKDGYIEMKLEATFHSKLIQDHRRQNPITSMRSSTNKVRNRPGEILIIGSAIQIEEVPESDNNATNSEEKTTDLVFILTPTIVESADKPQNETNGQFDVEKTNFTKNSEMGESAAQKTRIVHFPDDRAVGDLKVRDTRQDEDWDRGFLSLPGWALLGPAQGDVSIPAGEDLRLEVSGDVTDFSFLSDLKPNNLQVLILSNKKISDEDLIHLKGLTGLLALSLDTTPIEDAGLAHLAALTSLKDLSLFNTKVSDAGLEHLSSLKSLKHLILFITQVRGPGLKCLQNLTSLALLDLAATPITDESLVHVAEITWLKELQLQDTDITNKGLTYLKSLRSLEMLILGNTNLKQGYSPITDDGLVYLEGLDSLRDLHLLRTRVTDAGLAHLSNLKTLEYLDLKETRLTGEGLAYLKDLPALTYLNLEKTGVTEVGLKYLKEMSNLHVLLLDGENINETDLKDLEKALPDCQVTVRTANSAGSAPEVPLLSKTNTPSGVDKSIVKVDLSVVEVPPGSEVDSKTTAEIRNLLGGKITIPDSPAAPDLLRKAIAATAPVKDESAGDKCVTQEQFKTLFDLLVSRGYVKTLMNPTLQVVEGQTAHAQIKTGQNSLEVTANAVKDDIIYLTVKADLSSQIAPGGEGKIPMISRRSFDSSISINSGQSQIIGGLIQRAARPSAEGNAKGTQTPAGELICIVTASIIAPPADSRFVTQVFQLKYAYPDLIKEKIEGAYKYPANEPQEAVRVIAFPTTKEVTVIASPENLSRIAEQIAEWDTFQVFKPRIIELKNSDPVQMARMLTMLFAEKDVDEVNIRNVILGEDITGPLSSHFIFEDVPGTSKIIVMSNIPKAYETVGQLIIELDKQKMVTKDVKQVREWIARLVSEGRLGGLNIGGVGIQIETRILTIDEGFFEDLSLDADSVDSLQSWPEYFAPDSSNLASLILDQRRVDLLFNAAMNHEGAKMLMSPRILVRDAEEASMFTGQEIPRVSGYAEPNEPSEKPTPEFEYVKMGTSIRIKAHLTPDKSKVYLDVRSETNQIRGFKERTFMDRYTHMIPQIHTASLGTGNTVPLGKTLLIGQRIRQDAHSKFDKLVLADVSPVERSFPDETSRPEPTVLLMLLKPTIPRK